MSVVAIQGLEQVRVLQCQEHMARLLYQHWEPVMINKSYVPSVNPEEYLQSLGWLL